jgi:hypothetical protein
MLQLLIIRILIEHAPDWQNCATLTRKISRVGNDGCVSLELIELSCHLVVQIVETGRGVPRSRSPEGGQISPPPGYEKHSKCKKNTRKVYSQIIAKQHDALPDEQKHPFSNQQAK